MNSGSENDARIAHAIREVAAGAAPELAAKRLLEALTKGGKDRDMSASIFFLDLQEAQFTLFAHHGERPKAGFITLEAAGVSRANLSPSLLGRRSRTGPAGEHRLPILRENTMIGLLNVRSTSVDPDEIFGSPQFDMLSAAVVWLYEQRFASRLLGGIQRTIPYDRDEKWFLADLLNVIRQSSGMAYAAVRERETDETLRCLAIRGFDEQPSPDPLNERLNFERIGNNYPAFAEAMEKGEVVAELEMSSPRNEFLKDHPALKEVQSYVVAPIKVGSETFGTLSLATKVRCRFTPFELQGFESIANSVGIAITNFRNHHNMVDRFGDIAIGTSAIELSTSVRHATQDILERSWHFLGNLKKELKKADPEPAPAIGELETELQLLAKELQKFKVATERPTTEVEQVLLKERWEFAEEALAGRITNLGIDARYLGPELEIVGFGDWIGHLFLNLMLNSMDAFEQVKRKSGREIRLRVEHPDGAGNITAFYTDNATGIVGTKLVGGPSYVAELPVKQRIFEPHVTSKRDPKAGYRPQPSSGLGLFLVRKIMADHQGSVDLMESREGVRFRLVFPQLLIDEK